MLFAPAALLAVLAVIALLDLFTSPLTAVRYGPFGGPHAQTGSVVLVVVFIACGIGAARGVQPKALALGLVVLVVTGPVSWGEAFFDSVGPDVVNVAGSTGAFVSMILLVATPMLTLVGAIAALG